MSLAHQLLWLAILAIPIACVAWTVTHEEVFREPRDYCQRRSTTCANPLLRKFFYLFTCEYCFSHWVTLFFVAFTGFRLLLDDWRGYVLSVFALVWLANVYMSLYGRLRVDIRSERAAADVKQTEKEVKQREVVAKEKEIERLEHEMVVTRGGGDGNGR